MYNIEEKMDNKAKKFDLLFLRHFFEKKNECGGEHIFFVSSPEHKVLKLSFCNGPLSVVRPCVNNFFKQLLLWNHSLDFDQTLQEWSLGDPLTKLFKPFQLVA